MWPSIFGKDISTISKRTHVGKFDSLALKKEEKKQIYTEITCRVCHLFAHSCTLLIIFAQCQGKSHAHDPDEGQTYSQICKRKIVLLFLRIKH